MIVYISVFTTVPSFVFAQRIFQNPLTNNGTEIENIYQLLYALLNALISIGWIFVIFAVIYSGFKFVLAAGKPDDIDAAKKTFMYTIIGAVILLGSMAISEVICNTAQQFTGSTIDCRITLN